MSLVEEDCQEKKTKNILIFEFGACRVLVSVCYKIFCCAVFFILLLVPRSYTIELPALNVCVAGENYVGEKHDPKCQKNAGGSLGECCAKGGLKKIV